jgi:hypothetical protein
MRLRNRTRSVGNLSWKADHPKELKIKTSRTDISHPEIMGYRMGHVTCGITETWCYMIRNTLLHVT